MSYGFQGNPDAYPQTSQQGGYRYPEPPPPEPLLPEYAGFGVRLGARVLDIFIRGCVGAVFGFVIGIFMVMSGHVPVQAFTVGAVVRLIVVSFVETSLYNAIAEGFGGATLGKMICGLRVRTVDGGRVGFGAALVRSMAFFVDAFFFGLVGYTAMSSSSTQQRYGDRWARTVVVYTRSLNEPDRSASPLPGALAALAFSVLSAMANQALTFLL